jgi:hypothetical protein
MEVTSGRHEPSAFTSRWSRRPWRLPHADKGANATARQELETSAGRQDEGSASVAQEGVATEVSEAWSEQAPWEENAHALAITPQTWGGAGEGQQKAARVSHRSAEAFSSAVKHSVPRSSCMKPKTSCDVHAVKAAE